MESPAGKSEPDELVGAAAETHNMLWMIETPPTTFSTGRKCTQSPGGVNDFLGVGPMFTNGNSLRVDPMPSTNLPQRQPRQRNSLRSQSLDESLTAYTVDSLAC
jgi:hypothetical protein